MSDLQSHELVETAILGHLCKDEELKRSALSIMGREVGPLSELKNWAMLEKFPALSLEIAGKEITRDLGSNSDHPDLPKQYIFRFPDI